MPSVNETVLLRVLDAVLDLSDVARGFRRRKRPPSGGEDPLVRGGDRPPSIDAHLGGVLVAALRETFERDRERTEMERRQFELDREQQEADRRRADQALRLELVRQAGERETSRLRLMAFMAVIVWLVTAAFLGRIALAAPAAPIVLAVGWLCLLLGCLALIVGYRRLNDRLVAAPDTHLDMAAVSSGRAGAAADWLVLAGALLSGASLIVAIL